MSICGHLLCARYSHEGKIKKAYRYEVSRRFRWQRLLRFRKGFPEGRRPGWEEKHWARWIQRGWGWGRQAESTRAKVQRQNMITHVAGKYMNVPKSRCFCKLFLFRNMCMWRGYEELFKLFLQNKITSQRKLLLKCKRTPRNLEAVIFFSSVHLFLMSNAIPSSPEVLLTRRVIEHYKT